MEGTPRFPLQGGPQPGGAGPPAPARLWAGNLPLTAPPTPAGGHQRRLATRRRVRCGTAPRTFPSKRTLAVRLTAGGRSPQPYGRGGKCPASASFETRPARNMQKWNAPANKRSVLVAMVGARRAGCGRVAVYGLIAAGGCEPLSSGADTRTGSRTPNASVCYERLPHPRTWHSSCLGKGDKLIRARGILGLVARIRSTVAHSLAVASRTL